MVVDRPGWGDSDPVDYSQSRYRDFVADLMVDVLDGLGIDKVHTVGAPIGDAWVLALASKYGDKGAQCGAARGRAAERPGQGSPWHQASPISVGDA